MWGWQPGARERFAAGREVESESSGGYANAACHPRVHSIATDLAVSAPFRSRNLHRIRARRPHVFTRTPRVALLTRAGSHATKDGDSISTLLYVLGGWFCVSLLAYLLLLPMLRMPRSGEGDGVARPRGLAAPASSGVPSPQRLGYSGIILERLAQHRGR